MEKNVENQLAIAGGLVVFVLWAAYGWHEMPNLRASRIQSFYYVPPPKEVC